MARIISSRKKYVPVKDLVVYPSKTETIEVIPDDGDEPIATEDGSWRGNDNKFLWTSAIDDVFKDCFIPTTTYEKGPLQFEIDEQLNTTWYKK